MSYCRWSSMNWMCDLYVYEGHKFIIHVAGRRRIFPPPPSVFGSSFSRWISKWSTAYWSEKENKLLYRVRWKQQVYWIWLILSGFYDQHIHNGVLALIPMRELEWAKDLPSCYELETPGECAAKMRELRALGARVPQYAIDALEEEERERIRANQGDCRDG